MRYKQRHSSLGIDDGMVVQSGITELCLLRVECNQWLLCNTYTVDHTDVSPQVCLY